MEKQMIFHILEIEETKDERKLLEAYHAHLKEVNPEDDPEGFKRLREAYEEALKLARAQEDEDEERPKTEVDLWVDRVNGVYHDIGKRLDLEAWKELFADPVWEGLDTSLPAREQFIIWLMDHIYLPQEIFKEIDKEAQITEDQEELAKTYPRNFLNYVRYQVEHETFFRYEWFRVDALDEESVEVDSYLEQYYQVKRQLDGKAAKLTPEADESEETFFSRMKQQIKDLKAFELYHPYEDVERIRVCLLNGEVSEAEKISDRLLADYPEDCYVLIHTGQARYDAGRKEEAETLWERLLTLCADSIPAREGLARIALEREDYQRAKDLSIEILDIQSNVENAQKLMQEANEGLIPQFRARDLDSKDTLELGWCLFQNERLDEATELLQLFTYDEETEYGYYNLYGRVLFTKTDYEEARPYLERWLELILKTEDDGSEESKKRFARLSLAYYMNGCCAGELKHADEAVEYMKKASETADDFYEKLSYRVYMAKMYVESEQYEQAVDVCDQVIAEDESYYPAYLQRLEAYFEMRNGQQVVDDYHRAIGLYADYYKPYLFAEKVFFFYRQYEDAKGVLDEARRNNVEFSDEMMLFEVKILRNLAQSNEDRKPAHAICVELLERIRKEDSDIEDKSEVEYEIALLFWDDDDFEKAREHIDNAILQNPQRDQYVMIRGDILRTEGKPAEALIQYGKAEKSFEGNPRLYYCKGRCYEDQEESEEALKQFEKAVELDPDYADVNERLADLYQERYKQQCRKSDFERALTYINHQLELEENCYYLVHRGLLFMDALMIDEAIADYRKALTYVPGDWAAYNNMGYSYKIKGDFEKGKEMLQKAAELMNKERPSLLPYSNMADCYEIQDDFKGAIECYRKDLEMFPDHYQFWGEIGDMYCYLNEWEKAVDAYRQAEIKSGERKISYLPEIGDAYYQAGKKKKALWLYWKGVLKHKFRDAESWEELGRRYLENFRKYGLAKLCYRFAIRFAEKDGGTWSYEKNLAKCYYRMHRAKEAAEHAKKAMDEMLSGYDSEEDYVSYPAYRPLRLARIGSCYLFMGEKEKAFSYFNQMEQGYRCKHCRNQLCYEGYLYRGIYYEVNGETEQALREYRKAVAINPFDEEINVSMKILEKRQKE